MKTGIFAIILSITAGLVLSPGVCLAHKVNLFAYHEVGTVFTESYFGDGTPCRNASITASDKNGTVVAEGLTDEEGRFSFPYGKSGELKIVLRASMGHGEEITLVTHAVDEVNQVSEAGKDANFLGPSSRVDFSASEETVERIVESRIAPLRDSIMEIRKRLERPTMGKVVGGLGWIVGLAGAYLWGASRGRNRDKVKG